MKSLILSALSLFAVVAIGANAQAAADGKIGPAGCGLGNLVFGSSEMQILAATTNGTAGNQTFGITTGTLGCGKGLSDSAMLTYIQDNKVALEKDISRGEGESLAGLAQISGCANQDVLGSTLKTRYSEIFPKSESSAADITRSIKKTIGETPALVSTCSPLS